MNERRSLTTLFVVLLAGLATGGCELLVDKIQEEITKPGTGSTGGGSGSAPVPPPIVDPGPAQPSCASSNQCPKGQSCSVEWGDCHSPPGCKAGSPCPAICYGVCQAEKPVCRTDADCRLVADYCTGCDCRALGSSEADPVCSGNGVQCLVNPCQNQTAVCAAGRCVTQAPPPPACSFFLEGDDTTCRLPGEWKDYAYKICSSKGATLTELSAGGGDCGQGGTRQVKFTCCPIVPTPPVVTPPPPATPPLAPPGSCTGASDGGSTSCKSTATWKDYASGDCAREGRVLTDIGYSEACGNDLYRYMKYTCCASK